MNIDIEIKRAIKTEVVLKENIIRYAHGNENLKTWFITNNKTAFLPKGSRLLLKLYCEHTNDKVTLNNNIPTKNCVVKDLDGIAFKVNNIEWC